MREKKKGSWVIWYILLAAAFAVYAIWFNTKEPEIVYDYRVPPAPEKRDTGKYWLWDSKQQKWVSYDFPDIGDSPSPGRANAISRPELDEDELQEYLEKHIDGYIEDTYWGEEYDLNDLD